MANDKRWAGSWKSRTQQRIDSALGVIPARNNVKRVRSELLERLQKYLDSKQYDGLPAWSTGSGPNEAYVPVRRRKPCVIYPFATRLCATVASKILGVFPEMFSSDDPEMTELLKQVVKSSRAHVVLLQAMKPLAGLGSAFVRFFVSGPYLRMELINPNYVFPTFDAGGELSQARIQYTFFDKDDIDEKGNPREKWYRMDLGQQVDTMFDNPPVQDGVEPTFVPVEEVTHDFGFVQGEWFRTSEDRGSPDGASLIHPVLGFIDSINYSLSQADTAVSYSHEPQLGLNGMDEFEVEALVRSATKAWNLGREGKAAFIEADLAGVEKGIELRDKMRLGIQDITRIIMLDPEKMTAAAQSGKAMEVLHGPLVELVEEMRAQVGDRIRNVILKMAAALVILRTRGIEEVISFPPGWEPKSWDVTLQWHPIFPPTIQDLQQKVAVGVAAANASLVSRETITRYLAKDFGIENVEEEIAKVTAQPVINPFAGGF